VISDSHMEDLLAIVFGYVIGSMPFAFFLSRRHGVDLRTVGSGNVGATNVLRTAGVPAAVLAMCLDGLKGSVAVLLAQRIAMGATAPVVAGVASVVGHVYPVWLGFRGGKGVATAAGVFGVLAPISLAFGSAAFLIGVVATRYVSVGSLAGTLTLAVTAFATDAPPSIAFAALLTAAIIVHRHRGNLTRLVAGTERRVGERLS
jgi:acyl phosphate:glycerol-3-phosphate acyltransferase